MDHYDDDQETSSGPRILIWILLITAVFVISGFIPMILSARAHPIENLYRNCVEGESGIRPDDSLAIATEDGIPIGIAFDGVELVPGSVQQICFDLIVRAARYR